MPKYTYKDVIIDPTSEEAKNCVGKKCYHADNPTACLDFANSNDENMIRILQCIQSENNNFPFCFGTREEYNHSCIILKKEEPKPKYVPFESTEEFLKAFYKINPKDETLRVLNIYGIWIRCKESFNSNTEPFLASINELHDECVSVGMYNDYLTFKGLLKYCEFLDGTPCGKLSEGGKE